MKRIRALFAAAVFFAGALLASCGAGKRRYEAQFLQLFDTVTTVVAYMDSREEFERFSEFIRDTLEEYHQLYDIYNQYEGINNIRTINDNAGAKPVKVDKRIIGLLEFSKKAYQDTNGRVNIALGPVLRVWHDYRTRGIEDPENAKLPSADELSKMNRHTDINDVIINREESTVYLADPGMSLDVGAVAKGYAVEKTAQEAERRGYASALISVGGNVRAIGSKDGRGKPWNIGVENPDSNQDGEPALTMRIVGKSVVTSGSYQRYYTVDGKRYHHIIDPDTLMPLDYFKSVTIVCADSGLADMLSTAVFNMPYQEGADYIDSLPDVEAVWIMNDNEIKYSKGFERYLAK